MYYNIIIVCKHTGMWLEPPVGIGTSDLETLSLEPLYYRMVLSLFSLLTRCVESGAGEPNGGEGGKDDNNSRGLSSVAKVLLQTILTVSIIKYMYVSKNRATTH